MTKEEKNDNQFNIMNGFQFGFGFFLANLAGFAIVSLVAWLILLVARAFGWAF